MNSSSVISHSWILSSALSDLLAFVGVEPRGDGGGCDGPSSPDGSGVSAAALIHSSIGSSHSRIEVSATTGLSRCCFFGTSPVYLPLLLLIRLSQSLLGLDFLAQSFGTLREGSDPLLLMLPPPNALPNDSELPLRRRRCSTVRPTFSPTRAFLNTCRCSTPCSLCASFAYCESPLPADPSRMLSKLDLTDAISECMVMSSPGCSSTGAGPSIDVRGDALREAFKEIGEAESCIRCNLTRSASRDRSERGCGYSYVSMSSIDSSCARFSSSSMRWYASAKPRGGDEADDNGETMLVVRPRVGLGVPMRAWFSGLATGLGRPRELAWVGRGLMDCCARCRLEEEDEDGGRFSSFVEEVDLYAVASDLRVGASRARRGFASTPCPAFFFVGLGLGM